MNDTERKNIVLQLSGHSGLPCPVETTGIKQYSKEFFNHNFGQLVDNDIYLQSYLQTESRRVTGPRSYDEDRIRQGANGYKTWNKDISVGDVAVLRKEEMPLSAAVCDIDYFKGESVTGVCVFRGKYLFSYSNSLAIMSRLMQNPRAGQDISSSSFENGTINCLTLIDGYAYAACDDDGVYQVGVDSQSGAPTLISPRLNFNPIPGVVSIAKRNGQYFFGTKTGKVWTGLAGSNFTGAGIPSSPRVNDIFVKDVSQDDLRSDSKAYERRVLAATDNGLYQSDTELTCLDVEEYRNGSMSGGSVFNYAGGLYLAANNGLYEYVDGGFREKLPDGCSTGQVCCYSVASDAAYLGASYISGETGVSGIYRLSPAGFSLYAETQRPVKAICEFKTGSHRVLMYASGDAISFNIDNNFTKPAPDGVYSDDIISMHSPSDGRVIVVRQQRVDLYEIYVSDEHQTLSVSVGGVVPYEGDEPYSPVCVKTFMPADGPVLTYQRVGSPISSAIYGYDFESPSLALSAMYTFSDPRTINQIQRYKLLDESVYAVFTSVGTTFFRLGGDGKLDPIDVGGSVAADVLTGNILKYVKYGDFDLFFTSESCMQFPAGDISKPPYLFGLSTGGLSAAELAGDFVYTVERGGALNAYEQYEYQKHVYKDALFPLSAAVGSEISVNRAYGDTIYCSDGIYVVREKDEGGIEYEHVPNIRYSVDYLDVNPLQYGQHIVGRRLRESDTGGNFVVLSDGNAAELTAPQYGEYSWTSCYQCEVLPDGSRIAKAYDVSYLDDQDPSRGGKIYVTDKAIYYNSMSASAAGLFQYDRYDSLTYCHRAFASADVNVMVSSGGSSTNVSVLYTDQLCNIVYPLRASIATSVSRFDQVGMTNQFLVGNGNGISSVRLNTTKSSSKTTPQFTRPVKEKDAEYGWFSSATNRFYAISSAGGVSSLVFNDVSSLSQPDGFIRSVGPSAKAAVLDEYVILVEGRDLYVYEAGVPRLLSGDWVDLSAGSVLSVFGGGLTYEIDRRDDLSCTYVGSKQIRIDAYCENGLMQCQVVSAEQTGSDGMFLPENAESLYTGYPVTVEDPHAIVPAYKKLPKQLCCGGEYRDGVHPMNTVRNPDPYIASGSNVYHVGYGSILKKVVYDGTNAEAVADLVIGHMYPAVFSGGTVYQYNVDSKFRPEFNPVIDYSASSVVDFQFCSDRMFVLTPSALYYSDISSFGQLSAGGLGQFRRIDLSGCKITPTQLEVDGLDAGVMGDRAGGERVMVQAKWDGQAERYQLEEISDGMRESGIYGIAAVSQYNHLSAEDGTKLFSGFAYFASTPSGQLMKYDDPETDARFGKVSQVRPSGVNGVFQSADSLLVAANDGVKLVRPVQDGFDEQPTGVAEEAVDVCTCGDRSFAVVIDGVCASDTASFKSFVRTPEQMYGIKYGSSGHGVCIKGGILRRFVFEQDVDIRPNREKTADGLSYRAGFRIRSYMLAGPYGGRVVANVLAPQSGGGLRYETFDVDTLERIQYQPHGAEDNAQLTDMMFVSGAVSQSECIAVGVVDGIRGYYYAPAGEYRRIPAPGPEDGSQCHGAILYNDRTYIFHNRSPEKTKVYSYSGISYSPVYGKIDGFGDRRCNKIFSDPSSGRLLFATQDGIVRASDAGTYYVDRLARYGECLKIMSIMSSGRNLYFSSWAGNSSSGHIYMSQNGRDWQHALSVGSRITDFYSADRSNVVMARYLAASYTQYSYRLVDDYPRFTDASAYAVYASLSSQMSDRYESLSVQHVNDFHNIGSVVQQANDSILGVDLTRISDGWTDFSEARDWAENDMLLSTEFGDAPGQQRVSAFASNWFTDNKPVEIRGVSYIANRYRSGLRDVYVNIPTTYTHYMCHTKGSPCCSRYDQQVDRPAKVREDGRPVQIKADPTNCRTDVSVIFDQAVISGNSVFARHASGNSLPLGVYKDQQNACGADGIASNMFHSTVLDTRIVSIGTDSDGKRCVVKMQCFGTDSQSLFVAGLPGEQLDPPPGRRPPALDNCIVFSSAENFSLEAKGGKTWDGTLQVFTSGGKWTIWSGQRVAAMSSADGYKLYVRGDASNTYITGEYSDNTKWIISATAPVACTGNIETLRGATGDNPSPTPMDEHCYANMFSGCTSLASAPALPATRLAGSCYHGMFEGCAALTTAPALPATKLAGQCYQAMFGGCTSLVKAPELPSEELANYCYSGMFSGCTLLASAPALPATTLADYCYAFMFEGCTALTGAPALPAIKLASGCYRYMFKDCVALTVAPTLLAQTLAQSCYEIMFYGCTSLATAPALPAKTMATRCYYAMFYGCTSLTDVPTLPATKLADYCYFHMFYGCNTLKVNNTAPGKEWKIPVKRAPETGWGENMFKDTGGTLRGQPELDRTYYIAVPPKCLEFTAQQANSKITIDYNGGQAAYSGDNGSTWHPWGPGTQITLAKVGDRVLLRGESVTTDYEHHFTMTGKIAASGDVTSLTNGVGGDVALSDRCYEAMFSGCTALTSAPALPATTLANYCYSSMFSGCTSLANAPELPSEELANYCYMSMFQKCTSLTSAPALPAKTAASFCYMSMFSGCTSLVSAPNLPATTLAEKCYCAMFYGCSSLLAAPALPAKTMAPICYSDMFRGCKALTNPPALNATKLANHCYQYMFYDCTSLTAAPALPATTLAPDCYANMFYNCKSLTAAPALPATTLAKDCYHFMFVYCPGFAECHMKKSMQGKYDEILHGDTCKSVVYDIDDGRAASRRAARSPRRSRSK